MGDEIFHLTDYQKSRNCKSRVFKTLVSYEYFLWVHQLCNAAHSDPWHLFINAIYVSNLNNNRRKLFNAAIDSQVSFNWIQKRSQQFSAVENSHDLDQKSELKREGFVTLIYPICEKYTGTIISGLNVVNTTLLKKKPAKACWFFTKKA